MSEFLRTERQGPVATIWIDRQDKRNTLTVEMREAFPAIFRELDGDEAVRVVVLRGAGGKAFSAGGDMSEFLGLSAWELEQWGDTLTWAERCRKPVIAAIDGFTMGAGLELALACDFRLATEKSEFAFPEIRLGMIPGSGGTQRALRLIGMTRAKQFMMTGERISARTAEAWGLITCCVTEAEFEAALAELTGELAAKAPLALRKYIHHMTYQGSAGQLIAFTPKTVFGYRLVVDRNTYRPSATLYSRGAAKWAVDVPSWIRVHSLIATPEYLFAGGNWDMNDNEPVIVAVSSKTGKLAKMIPLPSQPVYGGLAAAGGRLFVSTHDGQVLCLAEK